MSLEPRGYFNWLRYRALQDSSLQVEDWQIADLRTDSLEKLFLKLKKIDVDIDKATFYQEAENCSSPEELTVKLFGNKDNIDQVYLLIFELWRRLLPEKAGLSLFCDELDHLIYLYDEGKLESDENLQDALAALLDVLDENLDLGADAQTLFSALDNYLGHDLEVFLYNYSFDQIDASNDLYAEDLIEDFYAFVKIKKWFDFLRIKIASKKDVVEANLILQSLIRELEQKPDLDLQIEILKFMVEIGDPELFVDLAKRTIGLIDQEEDFVELAEIISDYYRRLDLEKKEKSLKKILEKHRNEKKAVSKSKTLNQLRKEFVEILSG